MFSCRWMSYGPDTDFRYMYMCTVTLTLKKWPGVKVMTHPCVMDSNCVKYYLYPTWHQAVMSYDPGHKFWVQYCMCALCPWQGLTLEKLPWVKVMTHPWDLDNKCVKYYPDQTLHWRVMAWTRILAICAVWPWLLRYSLGSRSWHTLGSWTAILWNIIQIRQLGKKLWPRHDVNRWTDRQTGGEGDSWYPPNFVQEV